MKGITDSVEWDLLQSSLLKGELLAAGTCIASYEHRPGDC